MKGRRWALVIGAILSGMIAWAAPARAALFEGGESYQLGANETVEGNLYAFGETVRIDGKVHGDVVSAGRTVEIGPSAVIDGDVWGAAQAVVVRGRVMGDVRGTGYVVRLDNGSRVEGEMLGAGYSIEIGPSSVLSGELTAAGYQGIVDGTVRGPIRFAGNGMEITGQAQGNVDLELGDPEEGGPPPNIMTNGRSADRTVSAGLRVAETAQLGGNLTYSAGRETQLPSAWQARSHFSESERTGDGDRGDQSAESPSSVAAWIKRVVGLWLGLVIVAFIFWRLAPRWGDDATDTVIGRTLPSLGVGVLVGLGSIAGLVALVVALIMALIFVGIIGLNALVGPVLAVALLLAAALTAGVYLLGWAGTVAVASGIAGRINRRMDAPSGRVNWPLGAMLLVLAMLFALPEVGGWVRLAVTLLGLGAMLLALQPRAASLSPADVLAVD